jgi:radical SAM protein with 4Fe4S-binding SPASM domain
LALNDESLIRFFTELTDIWLERGFGKGVNISPMDQLIRHFSNEPHVLPCIWQANCADEFFSIDARGNVAQCDCWVTSYPGYFYGNIFETDRLFDLLLKSPARTEFLDRPAAIIDKGCIECEYLSICHGGCPVRTYTQKQSLIEKDPFCSLYKAMFRKAESVASNFAQSELPRQRPRDIRFESARRRVLRSSA